MAKNLKTTEKVKRIQGPRGQAQTATRHLTTQTKWQFECVYSSRSVGLIQNKKGQALAFALDTSVNKSACNNGH